MELDLCDLQGLETPLDFEEFISNTVDESLSSLGSSCDSPEAYKQDFQQPPLPPSLKVSNPESIIIGVNIQTRSNKYQMRDDVTAVYNLVKECIIVYAWGPPRKLIVQVCVLEPYASHLLTELRICLHPSGVDVIKRSTYKMNALMCIVRDTELDSPTEVVTWESFFSPTSKMFHNLTGKTVHLHDINGWEKTYMPDSMLPSLRLIERDEQRDLESFWGVPLRLPARVDLHWVANGICFTDTSPSLPIYILTTSDVAEYMCKLPFRVKILYVDNSKGMQYFEDENNIHGTGLLMKSCGLNHSWF